MIDNHDQVIELRDDDRSKVVERKATCPFIGSAVSQGDLPVRNEPTNPLARVEDVRGLGNTGGGDLGDVLVFFATGNHAFMRGDTGRLDRPAPAGLFSLEFPGSQGSHPGHSGILQGDPEVLNSGRFSEADFARLVSRAHDGFIKRSDVGHFIAENLVQDPRSKVLDQRTVQLLAGDLAGVVESGFDFLGNIFGANREAKHRELEEKLTKLIGEDNLVGSAGEFGLLFAFLANKPGARKIGGEPTVEVADLRTMFVEKRLPAGWETWKKRRVDWVINTTGLLIAAANAYRKLKGH